MDNSEFVACPEKAKWKEAMGNETKSLKDNKVWELTTLPPGEGNWLQVCVQGEDKQ